MGWEQIDSTIHAELIGHVINRGFCPTVPELCRTLEAPLSTIQTSLERLAKNHALVLHPNSYNVWIIHPFALSPTATWVESSARGWWAPCLWCAFGISALVGGNLTIHSRIGGESEIIRFQIRDGRLSKSDYFVHFSIPPRDAWNNVHHFCACVLPFKDPRDVDAWSRRHNLRRGETLPASKLFELAQRWYGRHQDRGWVKWSVNEAQAIFSQVGLTNDFWRLQVSAGRF